MAKDSKKWLTDMHIKEIIYLKDNHTFQRNGNLLGPNVKCDS